MNKEIQRSKTPEKKRAPRNRTLTLTDTDRERLMPRSITPAGKLTEKEAENRIFCGDSIRIADLLPEGFADLLILDPPYNLSKEFHGTRFRAVTDEAYYGYLKSWFPKFLRLLKPHGSVYLCGDWKCSAAEYRIMSEYLRVRNRITWEREKGRGALNNWKNSCEDIWFGTRDDEYTFHPERVKLRRKVLAPYREGGQPKDWEETEEGRFRMTFSSNFWSDISVPYWSMPENTDHPAQKPEKLLAKLILASSEPGDLVLDPFLGSGSTAVTARKLGRRFCGVEQDPEYCCWAQARLERAEKDPSIQGYDGGVFRERNSAGPRK